MKWDRGKQVEQVEQVEQGEEIDIWSMRSRNRVIRTIWRGILIVFVPVLCYLVRMPAIGSVVITISILVLWTILLFYRLYQMLIE